MIRNLLFMAMLGPAILMLLAGCGEEAPAPVAAPEPQKVAVSPTKEAAPAPETAVEPPAPAYVYDPAGRRDPFESLLAVKQPVAQVQVPLTPLQRLDIGQLRLMGVIVGKGEPRALVVAPDGKSYILKKGVKVGKNDGTVVDVNQEAILVEERYVDFSGEVRTGMQEIKLPKREGVE